jgi:hypothetical protein
VTLQRAPLSVEQALQRIAGQLAKGVEGMAAAAHRQPGTVRAWMDPNRPEQVGIEAAIELDLAYQAEGGTGAPLFEAYAIRLQLAEAARFADRHCLLDHAHGVAKEAGEAIAAIVAAARPGASEADRHAAHREAAEAFEKFRDVLPILSGQTAQPP